jgi:ureidoacrylate peracid hydrolase
VAQEHWCSSGFANTDLDLQLKTHGIHKLIVIGLIAHTCVEATVRFAAELGYHVTLVKDATAAFSQDRVHAALELNGPNFAHAILTTAELVAATRSSFPI